MFPAGAPRVFYLHLLKCGGTSLNSRLSLLVPAYSEERDSALLRIKGLVHGEIEERDDLTASIRQLAGQVFSEHGVVWSLVPFGPFLPTGTLRATMLRCPGERLVSQISDWRRLGPHDYANTPSDMREGFVAAKAWALKDFLPKYARRVFGYALDNYMTRAIAINRIGVQHRNAAAGQLIDVALEGLERDFDLIGVLDRMQEFWLNLSARLGLPMDPQMPVLNATGSKSLLAAEAADADEIIRELTQFDEIVYRRATEMVAAQGVEAYGARRFEESHCAKWVSRLRPKKTPGSVIFSVDDAFVGIGVLGRDGVGNKGRQMWTGPGPKSTIYMPVPRNADLKVKVWIGGYATEEQRSSLAVEIDDRPTRHEFERAEGYRDVVVCSAKPKKPFIKITLSVGKTVSSNGDSRLRGISFSRYGYTFEERSTMSGSRFIRSAIQELLRGRQRPNASADDRQTD